MFFILQFEKEIFWLPHNLDFRGRTYPIPPHLSHMCESCIEIINGMDFVFYKKLIITCIHLTIISMYTIWLVMRQRVKFIDSCHLSPDHRH